MDAKVTRIVAMYEEVEMTPEQIAMEEGLEVEVIKASLLQSSTLYRKHVKAGDLSEDEDISDVEFNAIKNSYKQLALNTENEDIKEKSLRFLWNEKKKRNDNIGVNIQGAKVNVLVLNESLLKARQAIERSRQRRLIPANAPNPSLEVDATIEDQVAA